MATQVKKAYDAQTVFASTTVTGVTTSGTGSNFRLPGEINAAMFILDVTADEQTAADKLNVWIQTMLDQSNWTDVVYFTQHDGNVGATRYISKILADGAEAEFEVGTALAEGAVRDLFGDLWRVRWSFVDDSGNASYTFSVQACPM